MKRKIIKQGHSTLTITLPSEWSKKFNLKAGSEIDLVEKDNGLFISTEKNSEEKKAEFNITDLDIPTIWRYFMAVYRQGYDEIKVSFDPDLKIESPYKFYTSHRLDLKYKKEREKRTAVEVLHGFVNRFIGLEIVEFGKDYIIVKEMGELTSKEFDNSLRRVFLIVQQMAEETLEAIKNNNHSILKHMHDVDINLDKFRDYCVRILNKIGNKDSNKSALIYSLLSLLELIGDEFKSITHHIILDFPEAKINHLSTLAQQIKEQIDATYDLYYQFDKEKIKTITDIDKKIYFEVTEKYRKAKSEEEKEIFHHLRSINKFVMALLELRIEMEF